LKKSTEVIIPVEIIDKIWKQNNNLSVLRTALFNTKESKSIIITDWKNWTHIFDWKNKKTIKPYNIKPIDTNWAGDTFRWAYVWWLLQSWDTEKIVNFSNKVAWLQCTKKGNLWAVPTKDELI
jgi:sugar/nucleoside kinase (ribokinase family)